MLAPVSIGELIDKISILEVKKTKITDELKLNHVEKEHKLLYNLAMTFIKKKEINELFENLINVNGELWDIEDRIRVLETEKRFEGEFIDLARKVYFTNDKRFELKNKINELTSSEIVEVKEYVKYK
jgi:hypothetical protein